MKHWARHNLVTIVSVVLVVAVLSALVVRVGSDRERFFTAVDAIGWGPAALSGVLGLGAVAGTYGVWISALAALGAGIPAGAAIPVFFVSQLGKYLPGSVWPVLAQMEAGRRAGVSRRTMLSANLLSLVVGLAVGAAIACALLPLGSPAALRRFWWLFLALPFLLALLHPRLLPWLLDHVFRLVRRPPLGQPLVGPAVVRAAAFSALSWALFGAHIAVLCSGLGATGFSVVVLSIGAMALAVSVGILVVPVPAGAVIREAALLVALSPILTRPEGLAVAVVSRIVLVGVDVVLAASGAPAGLVMTRRSAGGAPSSEGRGEPGRSDPSSDADEAGSPGRRQAL